MIFIVVGIGLVIALKQIILVAVLLLLDFNVYTSVMFIIRVLIASAVMGAVIYYRDKGVAFFDLEWTVQVVYVAITITLSAAAR